MNAVETQGLTKRYGSLVAVQDLDLGVRTGEVYGFLGANGAGKTTTLRMLLGLVRPTAGSVLLLGAAPGRRALDRVGAMIEGPAFYPYLSGTRNLRVMAAHAGVPADRVPQVLDEVGLAARGQDRYATYSLGMKQRLGLAAAMLKRPALLVLDEPTNGLDPSGMAEMRGTIRRLADQGCTVLLSSHLLTEVQQVCDRVGVIADGRLVAERTVAELASDALEIHADPLDLAVEIVRHEVPEGAVRVDGRLLEVDVSPDRAAALNRSLVTAGVSVHQLRTATPDLERVFFELTGADHAT